MSLAIVLTTEEMAVLSEPDEVPAVQRRQRISGDADSCILRNRRLNWIGRAEEAIALEQPQ